MATINSSASPVWPATAIAIFIVFKFGIKAWPSILLGAFVANLLTPVIPLASISIAVGNTLEALAGAMILKRYLGKKSNFSYQTNTMAFVVASFLPSLISASIGSLSLSIIVGVPKEAIGQIWMTWWIGDALGGLVLLPLITLTDWHFFKKGKWLSFFAVNLLLSCTCYFVFYTESGRPFLFLIFPIILIGVTILGSSSALLVSVIVSAVSVASTIAGSGPFSSGTINERLVHLQLFLTALALTSLFLSNFGQVRFTKLINWVLLLSWAVSGAIFYSFETGERQRDETKFRTEIQDIQKQVTARFESYQDILRGGAGLYSASSSITSKQWKAYYSALKINENYPGINGLGLVGHSTTKALSSFEIDMRSKGIDKFAIHPVPGFEIDKKDDQGSHYIVKFIEPLALNRQAIGLDVSSEPFRKAAAERARDFNLATLTPPIHLVQVVESTPGFLFFMPIYKSNMKIDTVDERRKANLGWVISPFIAKKFFGQIMIPYGDSIDLRIFDGDKEEQNNLVYDLLPGEDLAPEFTTQLSLGQRSYLFTWRRGPGFVTTHNTVVAWVGFCGAMVSLFLVNLVMNLQLLSKRSLEIAEDMTKELHTSREKFKEGERRLRFALEGSNDGIWDWDIFKGEMFVSDKISALFEWSQLTKLSSIEDLKTVVHPDDIGALKTSIGLHFSGKAEIHEVRTRYRARSGEWRWILSRGKVSERSSLGVPTRMTGVHIDIDAMVKFQEKNELISRQLENIANSVPAVVSQWDSNLNFVFGNKAFFNWVNLDSKKVVSKNLKDFFNSEALSLHNEYIEKALNGTVQNLETESSSHSDGKKRHTLVTYLPDIKEGAVQGLFAFVQDITELKRAEMRALEDRKAAIEASDVKSQFLANMSHEIRTPINGIIGMADLLKMTRLAESQYSLLETLSRSADGLLTIVNDVLDLSKVEAGKLELELINFDLNKLVSDTCDSFQYLSSEKKLGLSIMGLPKGPTVLIGDPGRLRQILSNLVGNAFKFTVDGEIKVVCKLSKNGLASTSLKIEIIDSGVGISEFGLGKIFKSFSQADSSTSRRFGGTGLGLSICKHLVTLMGGEIGVQSKENFGSTFWFQLKLPNGEFAAIPETPDSRPGLKAKGRSLGHILVVDDNQVNQSVIGLNLENLSYSFDVASDGLEALQKVETTKYDLIFMDCQMPVMDGYETTKTLRKHQSFEISSLPIIALTANAISGDRDKCIAAGMNDYMTKPIKADLLEKVLSKWISNSKGVFVDKNSEPVLDLSVFEELKRLQKPGRPDIVAAIIALYLETATEIADKVIQSISNKDLEGLANAAHSLKSSSANVGAMRLSKVCFELEKIGEGKALTADLSPFLESFTREYTNAINELKRLSKVE